MGRVAPGVGAVALFFLLLKIFRLFLCIFAMFSRAGCENECAKGRVACTAWKCVFGRAFLVKNGLLGKKREENRIFCKKKAENVL